MSVFTHVESTEENGGDGAIVKDRDWKRDRSRTEREATATESGSKAEGEDVPWQIIDCIR